MILSSLAWTALCFMVFFGAGVCGLYLPRLRWLDHDPQSLTLVTAVRSLLSAVASVLLAFLIGGMQTQFNSISLAVKAYGADLIMLDNMLRDYGPTAGPARVTLQAYTGRVEATIWKKDGRPVLSDTGAEHLMHVLTMQGYALPVEDRFHRELSADIIREVRYISVRRVQLIEQGEGGIPTAFLLLAGFWLTFGFAAMTFGMPLNATVLISLFVAALSMSVGMYLIIDLGTPFGGLTRISDKPIRLAALHMAAP